MSRTGLLVSCEHGGYQVPPEFAPCFHGYDALLHSHRGWDAGALAAAQRMAAGLQAPLFHAEITRLLVDLNRSPGHPHLHAPWIREWPAARRNDLVCRYHRPYRTRVEEAVQEALHRHQRVLHVSVHSFTPELNGQVRNADVGLLYDPARKPETSLCRAWKQALADRLDGLRVRLNYPYRGVADGLTTHLRRRFPSGYAGVEVEFNQSLLLGGTSFPEEIVDAVTDSLRILWPTRVV